MVGVTRKSGDMGNCGQDVMMREEKKQCCIF